ncbi:ATP-binding cassette transporter [Coprinopsis marcescibilis]|uniref:ATP-binding cassette transporter n=1 Tax=Coprinopsis marcescibilis TaxID=230819 RepID=A0A5C3KIB7_COPMA|nr:ATP-binding cassette transporter [Coprinopsis marcescibilis]
MSVLYTMPQLALTSYDAHVLVVKFKSRIWTHALATPAYAALLSAVIIVIHAIISSDRVRVLWARFRGDEPPVLEDHRREATESNLANDLAEHVKEHGGPVIFTLQLLRFLFCAVLLAFSIAFLLVDEEDLAGPLFVGKKGKKGKKGRKRKQKLSEKEWLDTMVAMTNFYALFLSLLTVSSKTQWSKIFARHLNTLLLTFLCVYVYRDIYPLTTFHGIPADKSEGWMIWAKIVILFFSSCAIPLAIPRRYTPLDPTKPCATPNPEQTASIFSLVMYSFLDPVVALATKIPNLSSDLLPPLAEYDGAEYLRSRSFNHIDIFNNHNKRHLFFGLMRVFRHEYVVLALMMVIRVVASFAAPLGLKNLLQYMETNGNDATIRPWFWITWLFIGPFIGSVASQWYTFNSCRIVARVESILTQLLFDHSLRIRVKAEAPDSKEPGTAVTLPPHSPTPPNAGDRQGYLSESEETLHENDATETTLLVEPSEGARAPVDGEGSGDAASKIAKSKSEGECGEGSSAKNLVGKINNMVATDVGNIAEAGDFLYLVLYIPLQIALCILFLYYLLGWSAFVGLATMLVLFPVPGYMGKLIQDVQVVRSQKMDARVETVSEAMNVIRMIKIFGWGSKIEKRIAEKREIELKHLWKWRILDILDSVLSYLIPIAVMASCYATFVRNNNSTIVMKQELTTSIVFSSMTVFDMLGEQLRMTLNTILLVLPGKVSLDRVNDFLRNTELLDRFAERKDAAPTTSVDRARSNGNSAVETSENDNAKATIGFCDASFTWSSDVDGSLTPSKRNFVLRIENELAFPVGHVSLVVGPTGSGKTSLLMALLGEMHYKPIAPDSWFNLPHAGGVAYVAQESWAQNETIKDNILFGSEFDEERYNKVIYQCSLAHDISLLEAGDQTEVGERGVTLSGGQKARITLARAIYSRAEVLLLDDVLAALDVHTAKWISEKCFAGDLVKGRTVILVTHNVALASTIAQYVVSVGADGKIVSRGSISDALKTDKELAKAYEDEEELIKTSESNLDEVKEEKLESLSASGKLIVEEEKEIGHVSWSALKLYFSAMSGHPLLFFFAYLLGIVFSEAAQAVQTWFLGYWATQYGTNPPSEVPAERFLGIYVSFSVVSVLGYTAAKLVFLSGSIKGSRVLHSQLVRAILSTTLRWLDTTPISRIITRFTQDTQAVWPSATNLIIAVDGTVTSALWFLSEASILMLVKLGAVVALTPAFLVPGILGALLGAWIGQVYMRAQLSAKREMSNAKAPVLGNFGAAIAGLTSIRAYGAEDMLAKELRKNIDRYIRAHRTYFNLNRWVSIRIDLIGTVLTVGLAVYMVFFQNRSAANTGFALNMAVGFNSMILWWIRIFNHFEVSGNSLERIQQYLNIEQEPKPSDRGIPPAYWPADGSLHVENLSASYSPGGPRVLHNISFEVRSGERVGIVGRTGAGKSSLTLSLLRCIPTEGKVVFAGQDISELNLEALRSNITIIPQVPELLSGTLRENLDPSNQHDDAVLNDALRSAGLFSLQEEGDEQGKITLDTAIASSGGNLSVGQRQIIALARAIIRGSKLLILDEATSAIDHKTDAVIQSSLRHELGKDVTILTVAHRLRSVMDADKIMVLESGTIVEFDRPSELLKDNNSKLRALVDESNDKETLLALAGVLGSPSE